MSESTSDETTSDGVKKRPRIDFESMRAAETPEFGSQYAKGYWDLVFEQLGRRWLFKVGIALLTLLYGVAAFAPLLANDRPLVVESVAIGDFKRATRVSPMAGEAGKTAALTEKAYQASIQDSLGVSPPSRAAKVRTEYDAAMLRVATMKSMLTDADAAKLDPFVASFELGLEKLEAGDGDGATAALAEAKKIARALRKELKPYDPKKPKAGGLPLLSRRTTPLLQSIAAWEVLLMSIWVLIAVWPIWNPLVNLLLLFRNKDRIRAARKYKVIAVLVLGVVGAGLWRSEFGEVAEFDVANYKGGITKGSIILLEAGKTTADLTEEDVAEDSGRDTSKLVVWAPVPYGYDELHEDEKFRPPTWTSRAERDPETGRPIHVDAGGEDATGVRSVSIPVQIRAAEPGLNHPWRHGLGTDESGRDILTRMIWGARISLSVGILSALLLTIIGVVIGSIAGFFGGRVDSIIMRFIEVLQTIPALFLILLALAFTPPGTIPPMFAVVIVIAVVRWTGVARLVRGEFMRLREQEFVVASRALGFSSARTIFKHVLPNAMSPVLVAAAFSVAAGILTESAVSFLGLGIKEPQASWGGVVNESKSSAHWWIQIFPGLAIFITVTCYNLVGDAIRDAMDPKMKV